MRRDVRVVTPPEVLSVEEIRARIAERQTAETAAAAQRYRYIRPLADAAEGLIDYLQNPEGRFCFGIPQIDVMLRGVGRGELCLVTGRAHSGKTMLVLQAVANNPNARVLFFTFDEAAELVLTKLVALVENINGETLEAAVKRGDSATIATIRRVASQTFRNLVVIDEPLGLTAMTAAVQEASEWWGAAPDCVVIDYLELLPGEQDSVGVDSKSKQLKVWTKNMMVPTICLHQANRSNGNRGHVVGMDALRFAGDSEATQVIGVSRRRDDPYIAADELARVANTITVNVDKNKRPPCKKGVIELHLNPDNGRITPLDDLHPAPVAAPNQHDWFADEHALPDF